MKKAKRHPREGGDPARRVCGAHKSFDARTRCRIPAFAGMTILLLMCSFSAHAADLIDPKTCQYLATYQPAPNVEYKPGVDVHGKPVVEADISPPVITMPEKFSFDVTVDVAQKLGLPVPPGQNLMTVGTIISDKGQLFYNGQPLEGPAEAALKALCRPPKAPEKERIQVVD